MSAHGSSSNPQRGTWTFTVDVGSGADRQQVKRRGFATKAEASAEMSVVVSNTNRGTFVRPARVSVLTFLVDEWLPARRSTIKPSTFAAYEGMIRAYVARGSVALRSPSSTARRSTPFTPISFARG